jgi:hypothetical protein
MKITDENILENILLLIDGELNFQQAKELKNYLSKNAEAKALYENYTATQNEIRLQNVEIPYAGKLNLLAIANSEIETNSIPLQFNKNHNTVSWISIAALFCLLIGAVAILKYINYGAKISEPVASIIEKSSNSTLKNSVSKLSKNSLDTIISENDTKKLVSENKNRIHKLSHGNLNSKNGAQPHQHVVLRKMQQSKKIDNELSAPEYLISSNIPSLSINPINILPSGNISAKASKQVALMPTILIKNYGIDAASNKIMPEEKYANHKLLNNLYKLKNKIPQLKLDAKNLQANGLELEIEFVSVFKKTANQ